MIHQPCFLFSVLLICACSCQTETSLFEALPSTQTGISFSNTINTSDSFNALHFEYIYNGAGVAASDFNGDGLVDLFFTGNQVSSELYLNKGGFQFEKVTEAAGLKTDRWCTGVSVVDINEDGKMDIYLSVAGFQVPTSQMENLLFINQGWDENGVPNFREAAVTFGLNDAGYSTQAAFLDYDLDGDLDLYLLSNAMETFNRNNLRPKRIDGEAPSTDRLYLNEGNNTFKNVSREAGILIEGYGLGVKVSDLNLDGWPDIYAANDFQSNDLVWINQKDGTFQNMAASYLKHQTHNGMGIDIADINNDALPDIAVLDMLPEDNYRQKMMIPNISHQKFQIKKQLDYEDQYMRNTLQLHQGFTAEGHPRFSEMANLAGIAATDWSWSVLLADFDNDGWKDSYITNGYRKDITNLDYINYSNLNQLFGTAKSRKEKAAADLAAAPDVEVSNYLFKNTGKLQFQDITKTSGIAQASFSNGAVYADLDQDGDLDLVVNNIDAPAFVFENKSSGPERNYLQIELVEDDKSLTAYNSKVYIYTPAGQQYQEYSPFTGYKSTVESILHFGLGKEKYIDSLVVIWPNGQRNVLVSPSINQRLTLTYQTQASPPPLPITKPKANPLFVEVTESLGIQFQHADNSNSDFSTQRTKPHDHAKSGPALATGDINGDGLEDLFVGGNYDQSSAFFLQSADGSFEQFSFPYDSLAQVIDAALFDADKDGDKDLYLVHGGTFEAGLHELYQDRLYLNQGQGQFDPSPTAIPRMWTSGACVRPADFDQDGDLDLFIGGRLVPNQYPLSPRSYLLENDQGVFTDVSPAIFRDIGMVTDALWTDFNDDQYLDLMLLGEWMPICFFENQGGSFSPLAIDLGQATGGWWMHVNAMDIDQDGDQDYLLGNLGLNSKLKASEKEPIRLYSKDFDENGTIDPLLSCYIEGREHLLHERDLLISQIPGMKRRFTGYQPYAEADLPSTLSSQDLAGTSILETQVLASVWLEKMGPSQFKMHELPLACQLSPIVGSLQLNLDQDDKKEILTAGNFHATEITQLGWYDASYGNVLGYTDNKLMATTALTAGLNLDGDIRNLKTLILGDGTTLLIAGTYGGPLRTFSLTKSQN